MTPQVYDSEPDVISPDESNSLRLLGLLLLQSGMPLRAAVIFDALCGLIDDDQQLVLSHACALLRSGHPENALSVLERIFPEPTDPALAWLLRGQSLFRLGRPLEAARAMRMFIRHRQDD
jgi:hypothetical protein